MAGAAAVAKSAQIGEYAVYLDSNAVSYFRVGSTAKGGLFILNTGKSVELIEMPQDTISSRSLEKVVGADLIAAARQYLHPLSKSVAVSKRAEVELQKILNNEEILKMATPKKAVSAVPPAAAPAAAPTPAGKVKVGVKKAASVAAPAAAPAAAPKAVKAPKASKAAPAPAAAAEGDGAGRGRPSTADRQLVVLKRSKLVEGEKLSPQATAIITVLAEGGKKMTVAQLVAGLEGRVVSKNVLGLKDVWNMNRKKLIDNGFIEVQLLAA